MSQNVKGDAPLVHTLGTTTSPSSHVFEDALVVVRVKRGEAHGFHGEPLAFILVILKQPVSIHDQVELALFGVAEGGSYSYQTSTKNHPCAQQFPLPTQSLCNSSEVKAGSEFCGPDYLAYIRFRNIERASLSVLVDGRESRG